MASQALDEYDGEYRGHISAAEEKLALAEGGGGASSDALSSAASAAERATEAAKDVVFFRKLVSGIDRSAVDGPTDLYTDSKSGRDLSYNPEQHQKTKHIERRHFFVRDMVEAGELSVPLVGTVNNYADFFTKPLKAKAFFSLRDRIMNISSHPRSRDHGNPVANGSTIGLDKYQAAVAVQPLSGGLP